MTAISPKHAHVFGTGCGPWWAYNVGISCEYCGSVTYISGSMPVPHGEVTINTTENIMSLMRETRYELHDGHGSPPVSSMMHSCMMNATGRGPVENQQFTLDALYRIEQKLNDRYAKEQELSRLSSGITVLQDKVKWLEQELESAGRAKEALFVQLAAVHDYLDCPCEMPLETLDLLHHLKEMHGENA